VNSKTERDMGKGKGLIKTAVITLVNTRKISLQERVGISGKTQRATKEVG